MNFASEVSTPFLLALHKTMSLSMERYACLSAYFNKDWKAVWHAEKADLLQSGLRPRVVQRFLAQRSKVTPERLIKPLLDCDARILLPGNTIVPEKLYNIPNAPGILFVRGDITSDWFPSVAVVGSRKITEYTKQVITQLVPPLARAGITITSGLALGTDIEAHKTITESGGRTIAVLGSAIDMLQPATNKAWAERALRNGTLVVLSEYAPGEQAKRQNFVVRNRLVAGLSEAVIIAQAGQKSGTIATAHHALEQGVLLYVVPQNIFSTAFRGSLDLLKTGLTVPLITAEQIIEYLGITPVSAQNQHQLTLDLPTLDTPEMLILMLFDQVETLTRDEIIRTCDAPKESIIALLTLLELKGHLRNIGNNTYARVQ